MPDDNAQQARSAAGARRLPPILLAQATGFACGAAGIAIASRLVAPEDYGAYGVFLTLVPLGITVIHAGLVKCVARHWAASEDRAGLLREVYRAALRKLPLLAVATLIGAWLAPGMGARWWSAWPLLFIASALASASWLGQTALQAGREHWRDFGVSAAGSLTRSFAPPLLYAVAGGALVALQAGFVAHALAAALAAGWALRHVLRRQGAGGPSRAQLPPVYDGPLFIVLAIAVWALTAVNRWIVAGFFGAEAAGYFTLAGNIAVIVTGMMGVVFTQYWQPVIFAMPSETPPERRALASNMDIVALAYTLCGVAGAGFLHVAAPWLTGSVISLKYTGALGMIAPAGCFGVAVVTGQFYHMLLLAARKERACAAADLGGAAVLVLGSVIAAFAGGETVFWRWLLVSPLVPWLVNRTLARRALFS